MDEDPFDTIARKNGWLPLTEEEGMTVRLGKRRYHVKRLTDRWPCDAPTGDEAVAVDTNEERESNANQQ